MASCQMRNNSILSNEEAPPNANTVRLQNLMLMLAAKTPDGQILAQIRRTPSILSASRCFREVRPQLLNREKSQGGSTRYPVICVAQGNCMDKGEPSNRRTFLQAKGGELYP